MGRDPVCNVDVDERSAWSSTYLGKTYYFNSAECKADFDRDPGQYALPAASRVRAKVRSMVLEQKEKAAGRIGTLANALETASQRLREQNQEGLAKYADRAAARVNDFSGYLQQRDADQIINEAEDYVRRYPALVIGSAFAAGFFAARFLKSSKSASS